MFRHRTEYAGYQFIWFFGVVEDRLDPLHLGRVRVRCHGWHTDDIVKVPTDTLPWAQVLMPPTSASTSEIGETPLGLVPGSFVFGFFLDGEKAQQPMVLGSLHGLPQEASSDTKGFQDPNTRFPLKSLLDQPDTNRLARPEFTDHPITQAKIATRVMDVPTAAPVTTPFITTEGPSYYTRRTWNEPTPRGPLAKASDYPKNQVVQSECGHVTEMDATPGQRRFHQFHPKGTFTEIQDDGTEIKKIVGSSFDITVKNKNVYIQGDCNITIKGDARVLVQGNLIEEVTGNHHLTIGGSRHTKIIGNDTREVVSNEGTQINGTSTLRVTGNMAVATISNYSLFVGENTTHFNVKNFTMTTGSNTNFLAAKNQTTIVGGVTYSAVGPVRIP